MNLVFENRPSDQKVSGRAFVRFENGGEFGMDGMASDMKRTLAIKEQIEVGLEMNALCLSKRLAGNRQRENQHHGAEYM